MVNKKKNINWSKRKKSLLNLLKKHKKNDGNFDCLVPCSGGKDGSYVAYQLKHKFKMNPLCITVNPPLRLEIGEKNLKSFINSGYELLSVDCDQESMRKINKAGFIEMGSPYYGWLVSIHTAVAKIASQMNINLVFYGEDGEIEYGGTRESEKKPIYDYKYQKKIYLEGGYDKILKKIKIPKKKLNFFLFNEKNLDKKKIDITHWSYYENWDPYRNYLMAKRHCGLLDNEEVNSGTFTNFAQNDQALYALHAYIMYLKFGFGRATQDACIEVRRGSMEREQAKNLINLYDEKFPHEFLDLYLKYFKMSKKEFFKIIDKFANKKILKKIDGYWYKNFKLI